MVFVFMKIRWSEIVLWKGDRGGVCQDESGQGLHHAAIGTGPVPSTRSVQPLRTTF